MQLRVVTDQPWDVPADVLVVPLAAKPAFDGPLGELDRRTGGELRALVAFGELRAKRYTSSIAAPGELQAGRVRNQWVAFYSERIAWSTRDQARFHEGLVRAGPD